jgi:hypothetical protein
LKNKLSALNLDYIYLPGGDLKHTYCRLVFKSSYPGVLKPKLLTVST